MSPSAITRLTALFVIGLVCDLVMCRMTEYDVIYDTECPS